MPMPKAEDGSMPPQQARGIANRVAVLQLPQIWHKAAVVLIVGAMVGGCTGKNWFSSHDDGPPAAPQAVVAAPPPPPPVPARPRRVVREARETREPEKVVSIDPNELIGLEPSAVERLLGTPQNVSKGDPSLVWTYSGQGCSFQIFFYPDIKTALFHALKYGTTGTSNQADNRQNCLRNILTAKNNGPG
jgi:hypothetical protein